MPLAPVLQGLCRQVSDIHVGFKPTGAAGVGANKGAVAVSCRVFGRELAFVSAHLAAH